jgi:hypothetical protein
MALAHGGNILVELAGVRLALSSKLGKSTHSGVSYVDVT